MIANNSKKILILFITFLTYIIDVISNMICYIIGPNYYTINSVQLFNKLNDFLFPEDEEINESISNVNNKINESFNKVGGQLNELHNKASDNSLSKVTRVKFNED